MGNLTPGLQQKAAEGRRLMLCTIKRNPLEIKIELYSIPVNGYDARTSAYFKLHLSGSYRM